MQSEEPKQQQQQDDRRDGDGDFRILSLDGGGVRGIAVIVFLQLAEKAIRIVEPTFRIHEHFDMFAGTSVGGIIATGLGVAEMSVTEISTHITRETLEGIFDKTCWDRLLGSCQTIPKYDGKCKTQILRSIFGEDLKFSAGSKYVLIPAFDVGNVSLKHSPTARFFTNHAHKHLQNERSVPFAWEVADATSAAPTYFPSVTIRGLSMDLQACHRQLQGHACSAAQVMDRTFVDGGVTINNPSAAAAALAISVSRCCSDEKTTSVRRRVRVLSVGTGELTLPIEASDTKNWGTIPWMANGLLNILLDTTAMSQICELITGSENHLRINSPLQSARVSDELDDTSQGNVDALEELGATWWRANCREVFAFFNYEFVPEAENVSL